jgi:hypothetical protein
MYLKILKISQQNSWSHLATEKKSDKLVRRMKISLKLSLSMKNLKKSKLAHKNGQRYFAFYMKIKNLYLYPKKFIKILCRIFDPKTASSRNLSIQICKRESKFSEISIFPTQNQNFPFSYKWQVKM